MKLILLFIWYFLLINLATSQDELIPIKNCDEISLGGLLGGDKNKIEKVRIISENEDFIAFDIAYSGYKDKPYMIIGKILDAKEKNIPEFEMVVKELSSSGENIDLRFQFKKKTNKYSSPRIESAFLTITVMDKSYYFKDLDIGLGNKCTYPLKKEWIVGANENTIVKVPMNPIGTAATIKQLSN